MLKNNIYISNKNIQLLIFAWKESYETKLNLTVDTLINDVIFLKKNFNISLIFLIDNSLKNLLKKKLFIKLSNYKIEFKVFLEVLLNNMGSIPIIQAGSNPVELNAANLPPIFD